MYQEILTRTPILDQEEDWGGLGKASPEIILSWE